MKILFLDMDGAGANSDELIFNWINDKILQGMSRQEAKKAYYEETKSYLEAIFPEKAKLVKKIIDKTGAKIVWSSDWRKHPPYKRNLEAAKEMLNRHNMCGDSLIGYTPDFGHYSFRGNEIKEYILSALEKGQTIKKSAVLDDRDDAGFNLPENCAFFQTNPRHGITEEIANAIISYLNS